MQYFGSEFIFNYKSSTDFDLRILDFETSGVQNSPAGAETTIVQKWVYRKQKPYHFGNIRNTPLEINLTVGSLDPIAGYDRSEIETWLLGQNSYLPLQIVQEDLSNVYYNIIFDKAENVYVANMHQGVRLHGICDSPWAWEFPITITKTYVAPANESWNFYNSSDDNDYLYPIIVFTTSGIGNSFSLTNTSDSNRIFSFTGISAGETITVDCNKQTIVSSTGLLRMPTFNKKFFRLIPGMNTITISGGISSMTMTYQNCRKIGG